MNIVNTLRALGPIDLRNIRRDSMLKWMIFLPLFIALFLRWGVPPLTTRLIEQYDFDLALYYPVLMAYFMVMTCPLLFGMLIGFLLLDEKDDNTLTALQITPLSLNSYIAYRITIPIALTFILMFIIFPMAGLAELSNWEILIVAIAAAPMAPMFALFLASIAKNKVQGFALMKMSGMLLFIPIFAYFVDPGWEYAFGLIPTYWPMKVYWLLQIGAANVWLYVLVAVVYQSWVTSVFIKRFYKVMHQ